MNGHRRRDSTEIKYDILSSALTGQRKTRLMYGSALNLKQLNAYIEELTANGVLEFRAQERQYYTTEKGRAFVKAVEHYRETVDLLNRQEDALTHFFPTMGKKTLVIRS